MMRPRKTLWLMSASGLVIMSCCPNAQANILPQSSLADAITSVYNTHFTYTSHPKETLLSSALYPLPKDLGRGWREFHNTTITQLASVCFVTDTNDCSGNQFSGNNADDDDGHGAPGGNEADNSNQDDYDLDNEERCKKEGYNKTSCPAGYDKVNYCPYDNSYFEKCQEPCPDYFVECEPPYYGVGTACGGKYASCEKDTGRACKEQNPDYVDECGTGQQLSDDRCSYDNTYGTCCNTCAGYPYTADTIPEGYVQDGESCTGCDGQEHFKIKPNPCDGYLDCGNMGPDTGAKSCLSGTLTKYDNCKPCPNLGTLASCPTGYKCKFEDCSGKYYKVDGCQSGYNWNANNKTCTCDSSYKYTCNRTNEIPNGSSCEGKYQSCECSGEYVWNDNACVCWSAYQYTCTGPNEAGGVGKSCDNKYMLCNCKNGYVWGREEGACVTPPVWGECSGYAKNCTSFDYLYSDGTCYPFHGYADSLTIPGKTPIAEVIRVDGNCGYAVALTNAGTHQWAISNSSPDIPEIIHSSTDAKKDYNSCLNTQKIIAAGDKNTYPAAWAAHEYKTEGTNTGDWCLPAAGLISSIYFNTGHFTSTPVNFWSSTASQDTITETYLGNSTTFHPVWFGTLHTNMNSSDAAYIQGSKDSSYLVRPVIEF